MTGLFGGVFDPPHGGHVALAAAAIEHFDLPRLVVLVAAKPMHKPVVASSDHRLELARLAFADLPRTTVVEDPFSYTDETLAWAREEYEPDLLFVMGADEWLDFRSWRDPEAVLRQARIAVGSRAGFHDGTAAGTDRVTFFQFDSPNVSSRLIRERLGRGEPIEGLAPRVSDYIERHGLYRGSEYTDGAPRKDSTKL